MKMTLHEFIRQIDVSKRTFSKLIQSDYNHLLKVMRGERRCGKKLAEKIEKATHGLVSVDTMRKFKK